MTFEQSTFTIEVHPGSGFSPQRGREAVVDAMRDGPSFLMRTHPLRYLAVPPIRCGRRACRPLACARAALSGAGAGREAPAVGRPRAPRCAPLGGTPGRRTESSHPASATSTTRARHGGYDTAAPDCLLESGESTLGEACSTSTRVARSPIHFQR